MGFEFKDIIVKKEGWKQFVMPLHKKILPVVIPAIALGVVFYNIADFFIKNGLSALQSKLFLIAVIFLYLWFVLQLFMLSCWVYTIISSHQKK